MNEKIENLLNISLNVDEAERLKSPGLSTGYDNTTKIWEIIIKYTGDIQNILQKYIRADESVRIKALINNYAIVHTPKKYIDAIADEEYIEFVEKPKQMYFQLQTGKAQSCISRVSSGNSLLQLNGSGVIVAIIDTGIDIKDMRFRNRDGTTRILNIYDQSSGIEWNKQDIDNYIFLKNESTTDNIRSAVRVPENDVVIGVDIAGHGTDVAAIACGSDGVAPKADIIIVKMAVAGTDSFPRTTQLMEALDYVIKKAVMYKEPVAVNISFGNNYGDHTGSGILEKFIDDISASWKCSICIGTGNEGLGAVHAGGYVSYGAENIVELAIGEYETNLNLQIWKAYWDDYDVEIIAPDGTELGKINRYNIVNKINIQGTTVLTFYGEPKPFSTRQEIYIDMIPAGINTYIQPGIWILRFIPNKIIDGRYDIWLPSISRLNDRTGFLRPDSELTFTIPSTSFQAVSVGAYNSRTLSPAPFSGRGFVSDGGADIIAKPELIAPGVGIGVTATRFVTGTSFATPFVTGSAALLMEWGIVRKNDIYMYGQKLKAYLINGAKQLPQYNIAGENDVVEIRKKNRLNPNSVTGWGALCLYNSIPQ